MASARIVGVNLPTEKRVVIALTYIYGIGHSQAQKILDRTKISPDIRVKDLSDADVQQLRTAIEPMTVEGDLRREIGGSIKRLTDINAYRGIRHAKNLPLRGQRTKTNARTKRGKRVTVGSGRNKAAAKT